MAIQIEDVGISAFVCSRGRRTNQAKGIERTFKARCGSYIRFTVALGSIVKIRPEHNSCKDDCQICQEQIASAKNLIESGK